MRFPVSGHRFLGFFPPYRRFEVLNHPVQIPRGPLPVRGAALLWNLRQNNEETRGIQAVRARPPGVALILILPPTAELRGKEMLMRLMASCRPHSILPSITELDPEELVPVLKRLPSQLSVEVTDYLTWRGIEVDMDTRRLLRRTLQLSGELRTVSGLARALYMSRRALGRRFMTRGLPVPSHWLHFGRVLRGSIHLQDPTTNLFNVGCELGYPDGFAFSNQLKRLTGLRPSLMRECFGWEWIVESWLHQEANSGTLSQGIRQKLFPVQMPTTEPSEDAVGGSRFESGKGVPAMRVAEESRKAE